jgi:tellurite resistance protein
MAEDDFLDDRRRSLEEDYFRKKDRELIEKMRQASATERARNEMSAKTGLRDPELIKELQELGFTPDTIAVLPLVPIVQMAWAEGGITPAERSLLVKFARERGIVEGGSADRLLSEWMTNQPPASVFARAMRLIRAMLESGAPDGDTLTADALIKYCESIAAASGGILGIGKISADERATLAKIAAALKART